MLLLLAQVLTVTELLAHHSGGPRAPLERVVRTKADWEELWKALPNRGAKLPDVDFATECVLLVAWGTQPTGGYAVKIVSVEIKDGEAVIQVLRRKPTGIVTTALTAPVVVAKTAKLPDRVRFVDVP